MFSILAGKRLCRMSDSKPDKWTIKTILEWTATYFKTKGIRTARLDAEVLLAACLEVDRLQLYLNFERPVSPTERLRFKELVRRRALREPVSLIIGRKEFWSLTFATRSGVLIPRPDTEILVQTTLTELADIANPLILEIGVGSGAVAVAIASERKDATIVAGDLSVNAVFAAQSNARDLGVADRVLLTGMDAFSALRPRAAFDMVCSNPPYIPSAVIETLEPEITFEPLLALDGGPDGLSVIRRLVAQAKLFLKPDGVLAIEMAADQEQAIRDLFAGVGDMIHIRTERDLAGKSRVIVGRRADKRDT